MLKRAFDYCPKCRSEELDYDNEKLYECRYCGFVFYQNTAAAVAVIIENDDKVLVVVRNREPAKGKFDFPGGFVDGMETAENAVRREIMEELGVELQELSYLTTAPNIYLYKNIEYTTCDIFYVARPKSVDFKVDEDELAGYKWLRKEELVPDEFAFMSMQTAIKEYSLK